jgi:hypothetical protein
MKIDEQKLAAAMEETRIATYIGRRYRWFPLLGRSGCLECDGTQVTLYDRSDKVVFTSNVAEAKVHKLRLEAFRIEVDGRLYVLFGIDTSFVKPGGKQTKLRTYLDRHQTLNQLPGVSDEDSRNGNYRHSRKNLWARIWVALLQRRGAATS